MPVDLTAFLVVAVIVVITPGQDMALVTRNALAGGRDVALATSAGLCTAVLAHALVAAAGLSALLLASATAFSLVKIAGAIYLVYLGIGALLDSRRPRQVSPEPGALGLATAYRQGVLSALLNPKLIIFFLTFLPQFIDPEASAAASTLLLAAIFDLIALVWLSVYSIAIAAAGRRFSDGDFRAWIERLSGVVLIALGLRVALDRS